MTSREFSKDETLALRVEALLFASGRPLTVHEISTTLDVTDFRDVQSALHRLQRNYTSRLTALELNRAGDGWIIQVRKEYLPTARTVAAAEIPRRTLKTLALVAYHQPILQSKLARMIGVSVYEDVPVLRDMGFIRASERAHSLELSTTGRFAEYFGFETTDKVKLKRLIGKSVGVEPEQKARAPDDGNGELDPVSPASEGGEAPSSPPRQQPGPSGSPPPLSG